jgi:hypothetical protein
VIESLPVPQPSYASRIALRHGTLSSTTESPYRSTIINELLRNIILITKHTKKRKRKETVAHYRYASNINDAIGSTNLNKEK